MDLRSSIISRDLFQVRAFSQLSVDSQNSIEHLADSCAIASRIERTHAVSDVMCAVEDSLSRQALLISGRPEFDEGRTALESIAAVEFRDDITSALAGRSDIIRLLIDIAAYCGVREPRLRSGDIYTEPDGKGQRVAFPEYQAARGRMTDLPSILESLDGPGSFKALVSLVTLLNAHPLNDGNGRCARVISNALLLNAYPQIGTPLPLYQLRKFSPYSLDIAIRSAELFSEWDRLAHIYTLLVIWK